jgi:hypothetical protein
MRADALQWREGEAEGEGAQEFSFALDDEMMPRYTATLSATMEGEGSKL